MTNEDIIQEILYEAGSLGMLEEVRETAFKIINEDPKIDKVLAYQMALEEWVK